MLSLKDWKTGLPIYLNVSAITAIIQIADCEKTEIRVGNSTFYVKENAQKIALAIIEADEPQNMLSKQLDEEIETLNHTAQAWWKAADEFQSCGFFDEMEKFRLKSARVREQVAQLHEQQNGYWRAKIAQ